jgi:hypothetical protein
MRVTTAMLRSHENLGGLRSTFDPSSEILNREAYHRVTRARKRKFKHANTKEKTPVFLLNPALRAVIVYRKMKPKS